jgi:hypothetical protein
VHVVVIVAATATRQASCQHVQGVRSRSVTPAISKTHQTLERQLDVRLAARRLLRLLLLLLLMIMLLLLLLMLMLLLLVLLDRES